mgnify:CR=1 FL=1
MTAGPPDYLSAEEMTPFYTGLFLVEGFGSETLGFSSTYFATMCGELGWEMVELVELTLIPEFTAQEYDPFIDDSTTFLREVDPLFKHCIETGTDYQEGAVNYSTAFTDLFYLFYNTLYHTEEIYESGLKVQEETEKGFEGQDSQYYQNFGKQVGKIFYHTFYNVDDFTYPDIEIEYPTDFDEEFLEFFN